MHNNNNNTTLANSYRPSNNIPTLEMTAGDALRRAAKLEGAREALVEANPPSWPSLTGASSTSRRWTYQELLDDAELCAHWLLNEFPANAHICVWAPNVPEWIIMQYGCALAGMTLVTANPAFRTKELEYVLTSSDSVGLFFIDEYRGSNMVAMANEINLDIKKVSFTGWLNTIRQVSKDKELPKVDPYSSAQIQYTSGTTGTPKGALLHHMGLVTNGLYTAERSNFDREIVLCPMPLFHTAGSVICVLGCVGKLSTLVLPSVFDPELILTTIAKERGTAIGAVPTMLLAMLAAQQTLQADVSSLKLAISGGSSVPAHLTVRVREELGCDVVTVYGQTELSPIVCQTSPDDSDDDKANTAGRPLWNVEVRIMDVDNNEVAAIGHEGEIQVRGYQTMLKYYKRPEDTAETLLPDGWLRTGDVGTMDERGYIKITGRLKDMIIRGGENIFPAEIESVLIKHEAIQDVCVFGEPDNYWGEVVVAAVIVRNGVTAPTCDALIAFSKEHLAAHKAPSKYYLCEAFPLTASGKVQKFALAELTAAGELTTLE